MKKTLLHLIRTFPLKPYIFPASPAQKLKINLQEQTLLTTHNLEPQLDMPKLSNRTSSFILRQFMKMQNPKTLKKLPERNLYTKTEIQALTKTNLA
jgi:hypothetical protein